jgi:hypothetical protein
VQAQFIRRKENRMGVEKTDYCSYLLRMWRDGATAPWRASLEAPGHAATQTFPNLEALFAFLRAQTSEDLALLAQLANQQDQREVDQAGSGPETPTDAHEQGAD